LPYSRSVKVGILKKVLPPESRNIAEVSKETGVSEQTIRNWINGEASGSVEEKDGDKGPRNLSSIEKYGLLMESKTLPKEELGECHSSPAMNHSFSSIEPAFGNYI